MKKKCLLFSILSVCLLTAGTITAQAGPHGGPGIPPGGPGMHGAPPMHDMVRGHRHPHIGIGVNYGYPNYYYSGYYPSYYSGCYGCYQPCQGYNVIPPGYVYPYSGINAGFNISI